jgi:hypothetical protein
MTAALMIALVITAGSATAQCVFGAYADAAGTESVTAPTQFVPFDVYLILRDEAAVEGASYKITFPAGITPLGGLFGPNEAGFEFQTPNGVIIGFGQCAIGFGGFDIQVAHYTAIALDGLLTNVEVTVEGNIDENPFGNVEYATCSGQVVECGQTQNLLIDHVIGTESKTFGAVKSLY